MKKSVVHDVPTEIEDESKAKTVYNNLRTACRQAISEGLTKEQATSYFGAAWKFENDKANSKKLEKFESIVAMLNPAMKIILAGMTPARITALTNLDWAALMTGTFEEKEVTVIIK